MNTTNFVKNVTSDNISSMVTNFFDEIMVLYNLIGDRESLDICTEDSSSIATFRIIMESEEDAKNLYDMLNCTNFSVYGNKFDINMILSEKVIIATISKQEK